MVRRTQSGPRHLANHPQGETILRLRRSQGPALLRPCLGFLSGHFCLKPSLQTVTLRDGGVSMRARASEPIFNLCLGFLALVATVSPSLGFAAEPPKIVQTNGRYALLVDGKPFFVLGGQIHNSSGWPSELPQVWKSMAALHANTVEAPVYWEQLEPQQGKFDFSNVDALVEGARAHDLRMVVLCFRTWKNGNMHY